MSRLLRFISFILPLTTTLAHADVRTIRVPNGGIVPEVALAPNGVLHLVYGRGGDGYYAQSRDGGRTFTTPVRLNRQAGTVTVGMERGPKLALGKAGTIHVVWLGDYRQGGGVWYTRSVNGGTSFEPERNLLDTKTGVDSATVTADGQGGVFVFWLDGRLPEDPQSPVASPIFTARSANDGAAFSANTAVKHDHPGRACACCRLEARVSADGYLYLSFRTGYRNVRDVYLLKGRKTENNFRAVRVSADNWKIEACPMVGAPFQVEGGGRVRIAWMSQNRVYWAYAGTELRGFCPRIAAPGGVGEERFPLVLSGSKGETLLVWRQGDQARWALFTAEGRLTGRQGIAGTLPDRSKPTAFAAPNGDFCIVF